jgi:hypothetical protein
MNLKKNDLSNIKGDAMKMHKVQAVLFQEQIFSGSPHFLSGPANHEGNEIVFIIMKCH